MGVYRAQSDSLVKCSDPAFDKFICLRASDLEMYLNWVCK